VLILVAEILVAEILVAEILVMKILLFTGAMTRSYLLPWRQLEITTYRLRLLIKYTIILITATIPINITK